VYLLISIIAISGLTFIVSVGVLKVIEDLLVMEMHHPPSSADKYFQEELDTEDWDRQVQPRRMGTTDAGTGAPLQRPDPYSIAR
jgi:hypothetical protein